MNDTRMRRIILSKWRWPVAWLAFIVFQIVCMSIDWSLRDALSQHQPMPGSLPVIIIEICAYGSLGLLFIAFLYWMPRSWALWIRIILAVLQVVLAYFATVFAWLYYVLSNGIDTL